MDEKTQKSATSLPPSQDAQPKSVRNFFVIILILAAFGLFGGYWSIKTAIEQPLSFTKNTNAVSVASATNTTNEDQLIQSLKNKDSDKDGLSDYDELNVYGSSPYLADSDSDGKSDADEIKAKTDPNCPEGQPCTPIALFSPTFSNTNTGAASQTNDNTNASDTVGGNVDIAALRQTLRNAGAPQADLDALSDSDLLALYASVVQEDQSGQTNANTNAANTNQAQATNINSASSGSSSVDITQLENLTPAEIRQLLKAGGADDASLQSMDDVTLKQIFLQSLKNL